ncbi:right-handed parallel beta-helix repeat-containing protein [Paradesertivirga mongoliensis]|uniref:Right-handed parallel beta-helix repeat-containing protein n=1 Tax=Paradesertivirga mongoliensis TaxID=2100740 RepID=A0ABW4ZQ83_9SPHI|nr:right-handed parallel beta-helix repeat-containing protein [Pedobacter mongoliensis]
MAVLFILSPGSLLAKLTKTRAAGRTYYVNALIGNDAYNGLSRKTPFKSLTKVNSLVLSPGDSVLFSNSTVYRGHLKINCRGTSQMSVVFGSYGAGNKPQINGAGDFSEAVLVYNSEYVKLENLEITNLGATYKAGRMGLHILIEDFGIANNVVISNLYVHDVNGTNVKKDGGGAGIHWTNKGKTVKSAFNGLFIENCRIERTDRNGITSSAYSSRLNWFPSYNVVIRNNTLNDIGGDAIVPIGCDGALIEHNVVFKAGQRFPEGDAAAGIWPWSCDNTIVQFNEVAYTAGPWDSQGFDSDWNCRNTIIQYNYSHDNAGGFLLICNDGSAGKPGNIGNVGTIVRYNVSVNDGSRLTGKSAGFSPVIHIAGPVSNTSIYNNVIYLPKKESSRIDSTMIDITSWHGYADSTLIANNIFWVADVANYQIGESTRNFFENNLYHGRHINIPDDPHALTSDPMFVSVPVSRSQGFDALKCFQLKDDSPCINAGKVIVSTSIVDFFNNPVLSDKKPAIGIYQP